MLRSCRFPAAASVAAAALVLAAAPADAGRRRASHEAAGHLTFSSPQANPLALSPDGSLLLVAATTSHRVDAIDTGTNASIGSAQTGLEPVSVAFKPDGSEAWVANHVSDSVSVIDTNPASTSFLQVVETIQDLDAHGATRFDEPVGVAFASNAKAYVALSSTNRIAIVDAATYEVTGHLPIRAQDPRAITVANGRLYVAAFESDNQTELSSCGTADGSDQCTIDIGDLLMFGMSPNLPGLVKNIVLDPQRPDRDVFVFDAATDQELKVTTGVGTLLYGLAVDAADRVYVTSTDARNHVNGLESSDANGDGAANLADLGNRMFLNEMVVLDCAGGGGACSIASRVDLDPSFPDSSTALATPYGITLSADGSVAVGTAAGTSRLFSLSSAGAILDRLDVGAIPKGVAFRSTGATGTAYVLNTLDNSLDVVSVASGGVLSPVTTVPIGNDPTPDGVRRGAIAFNDALASTSGTFSCGSCHPDAHTDQLLWRIGGECFQSGCVAGHDEPRTTMPVRGLRDALPLHWDGTLGDPFGGPDGSGGPTNTDCSAAGGDARACFRHLVDASLASVMCDQSGFCPPGGTLLSEQSKDDMAAFLERVSYAPARSRRLDDSISASAVAGFQDFFENQGGLGAFVGISTCADSTAGCHELPLGTATNSTTVGQFDAPTMRGMTDRFIHFSNGITGSEEMVQAQVPGWSPATDFMDERTAFEAAFPNLFTSVYNVLSGDIFQMFEEASTGISGAFGRQVTLNSATTAGCPACATEPLLAELEAADARGVVNLRGPGLRAGFPVTVSYLAATDEWLVGGATMTRAAMVALAQIGDLLATPTAHLRSGADPDALQPLIAPIGAQCNSVSGQDDPVLPTGSSFQFDGAHVAAGDAVFLNGQDTGQTVTLVGSSNVCATTSGPITTQRLSVSGLPRTGGMDFLQVRSADGLLSNEMPLN